MDRKQHEQAEPSLLTEGYISHKRILQHLKACQTHAPCKAHTCPAHDTTSRKAQQLAELQLLLDKNDINDFGTITLLNISLGTLEDFMS